MFKKWFYHPAEPWQFWYPQSSTIGGAIFGTVMAVITVIAIIVCFR